MEISFKTLAIGAAGMVVLGGLLVHKYLPRTVTVEKEVVKDKIVEHIVERVKPDGTKETVTDRTETRKEERKQQAVPQTLEARWRIGAALGVDQSLERQYTISVERRVLGPIWVGAYGKAPRSEVGVSLAVEF